MRDLALKQRLLSHTIRAEKEWLKHYDRLIVRATLECDPEYAEYLRGLKRQACVRYRWLRRRRKALTRQIREQGKMVLS